VLNNQDDARFNKNKIHGSLYNAKKNQIDEVISRVITPSQTFEVDSFFHLRQVSLLLEHYNSMDKL